MRLVHYSSNPDLCLDRLYSVFQIPVEQKFFSHDKPFGLWLSDDDEKENWKWWCENECYGLCNPGYRYLTQLDFAEVLHIKTAQEMREFDDKYRNEKVFNFIEWFDVAKKYKGIIISPYLYEMTEWRATKDNWYLSWDVASACVWDVSCIKSFERIELV